MTKTAQTLLPPKHILMVGNSPKFVDQMQTLFPQAKLTILSWRNLDKKAKLSTTDGEYDLVLICGYDYQSHYLNYDQYLARNVSTPIKALLPLIEKQIPMLYVDTLDSAKRATYSRYLYAKKLLGQSLHDAGAQLITLRIPSMTDAQGNMDIVGGWFTKRLFRFLHQAGVVKTIDPQELGKRLVDALSHSAPSHSALSKLTASPNGAAANGVPIGKGLQWPRPLIIDRALRMICG